MSNFDKQDGSISTLQQYRLYYINSSRFIHSDCGSPSVKTYDNKQTFFLWKIVADSRIEPAVVGSKSWSSGGRTTRLWPKDSWFKHTACHYFSSDMFACFKSLSIIYFHIKIGKRIGQKFNNIKCALSVRLLTYVYAVWNPQLECLKCEKSKSILVWHKG